MTFFFVYQISSQGEHNICWRKYLDKVLVQRMRPWHAQAPSLLNCYAENQVKNLLCFWKGLGWMREKEKQREKSESFCELTFLHDPTYLPRSLLKFTKWWWKWISCENSWRAEFWEGINERETKTTGPEYEPRQRWSWSQKPLWVNRNLD